MGLRLHNRENGFAFVYAFLDRENLQPYYIGSAIDPVRRLYNHIMQPTTKASRHIARKISETGKYPLIDILERVDHTRRDDREKHWIRHFLSLGARLLNQRIAGHGYRRMRSSRPEEELRVALHAYKLQHDLTYRQLSRAIGLGKTAETVHRFLVRRCPLQMRTFAKIKRFLDGVTCE